jgi:hypothetical protein
LKTRKLALLIASVVLMLVLAATGCTGAAATTPTTNSPATKTTAAPAPATTTQVVEKDKSYNYQSPRGIALPVTIKALAPRATSLDGKKVYIVQGEADPVIMPALSKIAPTKMPNTTWVYFNPQSGFGAAAPEDEVKASANAVVRGISW